MLACLAGSGGSRGRPLTAVQARRVYDRIGRFQDVQSVYERRAVAELLAHADFGHAHAVFELGHGTGALAARLLGGELPGDGRYTGVDVSPRMHELALDRLRAYSGRVELHLSDGSLEFPFPENVFDRFLAAYVLDLLSEEGIELVLREAARLLAPDGWLCLAGLTDGATLAARAVTRLWRGLWYLRPELVGGCRPLRLAAALEPPGWAIRYRTVVTSLAISSEVVVAANARADSG